MLNNTQTAVVSVSVTYTEIMWLSVVANVLCALCIDIVISTLLARPSITSIDFAINSVSYQHTHTAVSEEQKKKEGRRKKEEER